MSVLRHKDMKKIVTILVAMIAIINAQAKNDIVYSWSGELPDGDGSISVTAAWRSADNLLIGQLDWDEISYDIAGWQDPTNPAKIGFMLYRNGYVEGSVLADIAYKGRLDGRIKIGSYSAKILLDKRPADKNYPDQFAHPAFKDMKRFTCYSATEAVVREENDLVTPAVVLEKASGNSFAFKSIRDLTGYGPASLQVDGNGTAISEAYPYKSGCFTYDNAPQYLEFEIFDKFLVAHYSNENGIDRSNPTRISEVDGIYALRSSGDEFDSNYFDPHYYAFYADGDNVNDDTDDLKTVDRENWGVGSHCEDVLELSGMINSGKIFGQRFDVNSGKSAKPNIEHYFKTFADLFKDCDGLFKRALPFVKYDTRNGYVSAIPFGIASGEGIEMCFWRGAAGKDVVALKMRYTEKDWDRTNEERIGWSLYFFEYEPATKALSFITRWTASAYNDAYEPKYVCPLNLQDVFDAKLPQTGKTIRFKGPKEDEEHSCVWDAAIQWFTFPGFVDAKSASGTLDPLGYNLDLKLAYNDQKYYAGYFTFDDRTYFAYSFAPEKDNPFIDLQIFENACQIGALRVEYEEDKGSCNGKFDMGGQTFDIEMRINPGAKMENPFARPDFASFCKFSHYHYQIESADYMYAVSITLARDKDGFAFRVAGSDADGYGTVKDFDKKNWTVLPYKDGKVIYKDPYGDEFHIDFYRDFIVASCHNTVEDGETNAIIASGLYMLTETGDTFNKSWLFPMGEPDR